MFAFPRRTVSVGVLLSLFFTFTLFLSAATAQPVQLLGDFKDWSAYTTSQASAKLCFILSKPKNIRPKPANYTQSYLFLSHRPSENIRYELNLIAGFKFHEDSQAEIIIGSQSYELFSKDDAVWLADRKQSEKLAGQMRAGSVMTIRGRAENGELIEQIFSLAGVTAATRAINRECP